ncbi:MAG: AraC family transcriptional regulator [Mucilaginibacter sp.]
MVTEIKTIKFKDKIVFEKLVMPTNTKRLPKFFQENEACFLYLTKGAFQLRTPTNILTYKENEAMLAKCGNYFIEQVSKNENKEEETISAIGAFFYPDIVKGFFEKDLSIQNFQYKFDVIKVDIGPLLKSCIDGIDFLLDNPAIADENLIINKLKELLLILSKSKNAASVNSFISSLFAPYEYNFNEVVQHNIYANLSLGEFAKLCNYSLATFKRKFTALYHESPAKYIVVKKLERSKQLLQMKSKPIAAIAYECGFETVTNFNKSFKKHFGKSPSEFRLS